MGNCLVTKLKSVCDNDALIGMGEAVINVSSAEKFSFSFAYHAGHNGKLTIKGDGYFTNENDDNLGKELIPNLDQITNATLSAGTYKVIVSDKYMLRHIDHEAGATSPLTMDITQLNYNTNRIGRIRGINVTGSVFKHSHYVAFYSPKTSTVVYDLKVASGNFEDVTALDILAGYSGDITDLYNVKSTTYAVTVRGLTGTLESLVVKRAAQNVAGTVVLIAANWTINGTVSTTSAKMTYTADGNCTVTNTAGDTTFATYINGVWSYS